MAMLHVVEIIDKLMQGATEPLLCRAEDGKLYVVKGKHAGNRALICEWLGGHLARELGLPVPPFALLRLSPGLLAGSADVAKAGLLGDGTLFGSEFQPLHEEIGQDIVESVDERLRATILLFDWWTGNADRTLVDGEGNPNLLWSELTEEIQVIDHNLTFDFSCKPGIFRSYHIFRDSAVWLRNEAFRADVARKMEAAIDTIPPLWRSLPEEWTESENHLTLPYLHAYLSRFRGDTFWSELL